MYLLEIDIFFLNIRVLLTNFSTLFFFLSQRYSTYIFLLYDYTLSFKQFPSLFGGFSNSLAIKHPIMLSLFYLALFTTNFRKSLLLGTVALLLGSYWAGVEFNWGGFWSYDIVETSLIFKLIILIYGIHLRDSLFKTVVSSVLILKPILLIFLSLKFIDLQSIHLFITQQTNMYYVNIMLLLCWLNPLIPILFIQFIYLTYMLIDFYYYISLIILLYLYIPKSHSNMFILLLLLSIFYLLFFFKVLTIKPIYQILFSVNNFSLIGLQNNLFFINFSFLQTFFFKPSFKVLGACLFIEYPIVYT